MSAFLEVKNLKKYYPVEKGVFRQTSGWVKALDGINFTVGEKETLGLVGESGCGKTTCGRVVANLLAPTAGEILFQGRPIAALKGKELQKYREQVQIIFQDPYSSLNPRQKIGDIILEPMNIHGLYTKKQRKEKVQELLQLVGLSSDIIRGYSHQLSGGQRQRVGIARALSVNPRLIVCDEPVSSLDISIQAQIINLLLHLQQRYNITYLFISHDLGVVKHIAHRIAVMNQGQIMELAATKDIFHRPQHPYTKLLLESVPSIKWVGRRISCLLSPFLKPCRA